jgi:hypothetical protein
VKKAGAAPRLRDRVRAFVQLDQHATARRTKSSWAELNKTEYVPVEKQRLLEIADGEAYLSDVGIGWQDHPANLPYRHVR